VNRFEFPKGGRLPGPSSARLEWPDDRQRSPQRFPLERNPLHPWQGTCQSKNRSKGRKSADYGRTSPGGAGTVSQIESTIFVTTSIARCYKTASFYDMCSNVNKFDATPEFGTFQLTDKGDCDRWRGDLQLCS